MSRKFTPIWKDDEGNRLIFAYENTVFDDEGESSSYQIGQFLWMVAFGLSMAGQLEFDMDENGHATIEHVEAKAGRLGTCQIISGPIYEKSAEMVS